MPAAATKMEKAFSAAPKPNFAFNAAPKPNFAYTQQKPQGNPMGARSFEQLNEWMGGALIQDERGDWFRKVPYHIGPDGVYFKDGRLVQEVHWALRAVALTKEAARESTMGGTEADWYDGWTWWRRGQKPEKDIHVMSAHEQDSEITFEDASPSSAAAYQQIAVHAQAVKPVAPVVQAKE